MWEMKTNPQKMLITLLMTVDNFQKYHVNTSVFSVCIQDNQSI